MNQNQQYVAKVNSILEELGSSRKVTTEAEHNFCYWCADRDIREAYPAHAILNSDDVFVGDDMDEASQSEGNLMFFIGVLTAFRTI